MYISFSCVRAKVYGVTSVCRLLKITSLFCKRALWKRRHSTKETYDFKETPDRSHPTWSPALFHMCDIIHLYAWHDSFLCVPCLLHICDMARSYAWHGAFICVTWRIHMCDMTHSYVWHDSFTCMTRLVQTCGMTHSYMWHDSFMCVCHDWQIQRSCVWWLHTCIWGGYD